MGLPLPGASLDGRGWLRFCHVPSVKPKFGSHHVSRADPHFSLSWSIYQESVGRKQAAPLDLTAYCSLLSESFACDTPMLCFLLYFTPKTLTRNPHAGLLSVNDFIPTQAKAIHFHYQGWNDSILPEQEKLGDNWLSLWFDSLFDIVCERLSKYNILIHYNYPKREPKKYGITSRC